MLRLVRIEPSPRPTKKWRAVWNDSTHTDFGASGAEDFTTGASMAKWRSFRARHLAQNGERIENTPKSAAALSYWVLWGASRDREANLRAFRQRFGV